MQKIVRIQVDCSHCHSTHNKMLSEKDRWKQENNQYKKVGKFQCLACDKKFSYVYGIDQE